MKLKQTLSHVHPLAWTIIIGTVFGRLAATMSIPYLSIYLVKVLGASSTVAGLTIAVSTLAGVFASFYGGYLSDRIGRKKVMIISALGWACVFFGFSGAHAIWMFFVVNTLNGLCRSMFEPASRALLSDVTPKEHRLLVFNMRYFGINLGVVFGPLLGIALGATQSTFPFVIAGIVYVIYGLIIILQFRLHPKHGDPVDQTNKPQLLDALKITSQDRVFLPVLLGTMFCVLGYGYFEATLPQYLTDNPHFHNGSTLFSYMLTLNAITVLVVQYPVVRLSKRLPVVMPIILGNICVTISLLILGAAHSLTLLFIGVVIFTVGEVMMFTMMDMLIDRIAKPEWRGTYFGTIGFNNLGNVIAPILGGFLIDHLGKDNGPHIFVPLAMTTIIGVPLLLIARKRLLLHEQEKQQAQEQVVPL